MVTIRRRIPFKTVDEDEVNTDGEILDEQQQDELIEGLRKDNEIVNRRYSAALKVVVGLSCMLQLATFNYNPLLTMYPTQEALPYIPLPAFFSILAIFIHLCLIIMFFSHEVRVRFQISIPFDAIPYQHLYSLSAIAPTICLFFNKPWQTILWWCTTPLMVFIVHTVMDAIQQSSQGIAELENMKYTAPGV